MDFAYDDRTQDLRERLLAFMEEHVYPAHTYTEIFVSGDVYVFRRTH